MELKPGNLEHLIKNHLSIGEPRSTKPFLHQMLQALDYLASKEIIHRDDKPENILCTSTPDGSYLYQLADFGLANIVANSRTFAGTETFMAPELDQRFQVPQTPKMDVWSLFITLAYAANIAGFRGRPLQTTPLKVRAAQDAANGRDFRALRRMAIADPDQRASAGDMLDALFQGEGRTTPRSVPYIRTRKGRARVV